MPTNTPTPRHEVEDDELIKTIIEYANHSTILDEVQGKHLERLVEFIKAREERIAIEARVGGIRAGMNMPAHDAMVAIDKLKLTLEN